MDKRSSGILLHITSLPSLYGIGDLGPEAYRFADFLAEAKQRYWQVLPLNLTNIAHASSPYSGISAYAGNPLLISPEYMHQEGFLEQKDLDIPLNFVRTKSVIDYPAVFEYKESLFRIAYNRFKNSKNNWSWNNFYEENSYWLDDFVLFVSIKEHFDGKPWYMWPKEIRNREEVPLQSLKDQLQDNINKEMFLQYLFFTQWTALKEYCNEKGINIIGDMPIYVNYDSVSVWNNPDLFNLDNDKNPITVAGVPPDYFSETGQLWGNPTYKWDVLKSSGYKWWFQRLEYNFKLFDIVRIDHFRGFSAFWEVPANETTAINGKWVEAPGHDFFDTLIKRFPSPPIIAEDLGIITQDVTDMMNKFNFPGMKVLLFAFGFDLPTNPYAPHNHVKNCIVYTGTHDNNTVKGWYENETTSEDKDRLFKYIGNEVKADHIHLAFIRIAMMSVANTVIIPMQDMLGLGQECRMNLPSTTEKNWEWRITEEQITPEITAKLLEMTEIYGRA